MRRPTSTTGPRTLVVAPRDGTATLPSFTPEAPVDGWTPATVSAVSAVYADDVANRVGLSHRRVSKCAEVALYRALPASVKKAQAVERIRRAGRIDDGPKIRPAANDDTREEPPF